jgi:hypothetical protein
VSRAIGLSLVTSTKARADNEFFQTRGFFFFESSRCPRFRGDTITVPWRVRDQPTYPRNNSRVLTMFLSPVRVRFPKTSQVQESGALPGALGVKQTKRSLIASYRESALLGNFPFVFPFRAGRNTTGFCTVRTPSPAWQRALGSEQIWPPSESHLRLWPSDNLPIRFVSL